MNKTQKLQDIIGQTSREYREKYGREWRYRDYHIIRCGYGFYLADCADNLIWFLGRYERAVRWFSDILDYDVVKSVYED